MNYGLYTAASGLLVNQYRMDVLSNNMANVNTVGFKPELPTFRWRAAERVEDFQPTPPKQLLERLGGGVLLNPNVTKFQEGTLTKTGNDLDVAIRGEGFFVFNTGKGEDNERLRFSRDGRFTVSSEGYLVQASSGMRVLDDRDRPIRLRDDAPVKIASDGTISQDGLAVARIQVTTVPDVAAFRKIGSNAFVVDNVKQTSRLPARGALSQGWIEGSAVDPLMTLMHLTSATNAIGTATRMIGYHDQAMNAVINRFARVA